MSDLNVILDSVAFREEMERKLTERSIPEPNTGCHIWLGGVARRGYGGIHFRHLTFVASRVAWALRNGPIPAGMMVRHKCDNPPCVNPAHLELGTRQENMDDMVRRGRSPKGARNTCCANPELIVRGEGRWNAALTEELVREIRTLYWRGHSAKSISEELGLKLDKKNISRIANKQRWQHVDAESFHPPKLSPPELWAKRRYAQLRDEILRGEGDRTELIGQIFELERQAEGL